MERLDNQGRFASPDRYVPAPRDKAPGLGSTASEEVPQGPGQPVQEPADFTGIRSRSRFVGEPHPPVVGHGGATSGAIIPLQDLPEPNLDTQFGPSHILVDPASVVDESARREGTLGVYFGRLLIRLGRLMYVRDRDPGGEKPPGPAMGGPGGGINRASDLIRWSDFGTVPGKVNRRYTLRPEFMQGAQTFLGLHGVQRPGAKGSTSPVRMLPPRVSRLTDRRLPGSFGQTTEVLN